MTGWAGPAPGGGRGGVRGSEPRVAAAVFRRDPAIHSFLSLIAGPGLGRGERGTRCGSRIYRGAIELGRWDKNAHALSRKNKIFSERGPDRMRRAARSREGRVGSDLSQNPDVLFTVDFLR